MGDRINPKSRNKRSGEARYKKETRTSGHTNPSGSYSIPIGNRRTMTGQSENKKFQLEAAGRAMSGIAKRSVEMAALKKRLTGFKTKVNDFDVVPPGVGGRVKGM